MILIWNNCKKILTFSGKQMYTAGMAKKTQIDPVYATII